MGISLTFVNYITMENIVITSPAVFYHPKLFLVHYVFNNNVQHHQSAYYPSALSLWASPMLTSLMTQNTDHLRLHGLTYRSLLASLSDSRSVSTSPSLTGPFTFLMIERLLSSMNSTRTWWETGPPKI